MEAKGAKFLKVTGILMIIGGALSIILGIVAIIGVAALALLGANAGMLYVAAIVALVGAIAQLIAGIVGCKNAKKPEKAVKCLVWGIIVAVLSVLGNILTAVGGGDFSVVGLLTGLVIPVLYIIGAIKNKA